MSTTNNERAEFPSLYERTGDITDINTLLVPRASLAANAPAAEPVACVYQASLDIRTAQGWQLGGEKCPVLYTDTINGQQVRRDDLWLCTTAAFTAPPAPTEQPDGVLWCVNVQGPDDVYAMQSRALALDEANRLNIYFAKQVHHECDPIMRAMVIEWPHSPESHAEALLRAAPPQGAAKGATA